MDALCSRCGHYIFVLWFLLLSFSSPNLSRRKLDLYHTSAHGVACTNLECRSEMCCRRLAGNAGPKKSAPAMGTFAQLCRAISLQLRHVSTIGKTF